MFYQKITDIFAECSIDYEINGDSRIIDANESEYEKYKIIQDKKFVSDFDKLLIEANKINNK